MKENLGRGNPTPNQGFFPHKSVQVNPSETTTQEIEDEPGDALFETNSVDGIEITF